MKPWTGTLVLSVLLGIAFCHNLPIASQLPNQSIVSERASVPPGECTDPPGNVTLKIGDYAAFTSPNYPNNYNGFQHCSWNFKSDVSAYLELSCRAVQMSWFATLYIIDRGERIDSGCVFCLLPRRFEHTVLTNTAQVGIQNNAWMTNKGFTCRITAGYYPGYNICKCGIVNSGRIVGGNETAPNKYPWMALLVRPGSNSNFCGGSVITDQFVLTAAHCTDGQLASNIQVRLGIHDKLSSPPADSLRRDVLQIINHPSYNSSTTNNDVSLLRISVVDFSLHPNIRPICLPIGSDNYANREATTAGWGTTSAGGSTSSVLMAVKVPVLSQCQCVSYLGSNVTDAMMCAGSEGLDSCQGDSGGPLFLSAEFDRYQIIVGIVSWGYGCGSPRSPGVYTRVTVFTEWIRNQVSTSSFCSRP